MEEESAADTATTGLTEVLVHIVDISNQVMSVSESYLFSQTVPSSIDMEENMHHTRQSVYTDDSIRTLKLKISKAIGDVNLLRNGELPEAYTYPPIESMYLYTRRLVPSSELDVEKLYQEITKHDTNELSASNMELFLRNFSIPFQLKTEYDMNFFLETVQQAITDKHNDLQGVLQLVPMGFQYGKIMGTTTVADYTFPVNPMYCSPTVIQEIKKKGWTSDQILVPYDHHLLLRYLPLFQNEIYVCFSKDVSPEVRPYYFPESPKLMVVDQEIKAKIVKSIRNMEQYDHTRTFFHQVADQLETAVSATQTLPKMDKHIRAFTITMMNRTRIPLDILFKNISSNLYVPGIIYNPGKNKENILRLYSKRVSNNGKRIPLLTKRQITHFSKFAKRNTIVYYLPKKNEEEEDKYEPGSIRAAPVTEPYMHVADAMELFVKLDTMSNIHIHWEDAAAALEESSELLDQVLRYKLNPLLQYLNTFLQKSGYMIPLFEQMNHANIGLKHFHVQWKFRSTFFALLQEIPCIRQLFDVYEEETDEERIVLKYKGVYSEYEGQGMLIKELRRQSVSDAGILQALHLNYHLPRLPKDVARIRLDRYDEFQEEYKLNKSPNREFSFFVEIHHEEPYVVIDIFKYCRDCGHVVAEEDTKLRTRRKARRNDTLPDLPNISYMYLVETYLSSILAIVSGVNRIPVPDICTAAAKETLDVDPSSLDTDMEVGAAALQSEVDDLSSIGDIPKEEEEEEEGEEEGEGEESEEEEEEEEEEESEEEGEESEGEEFESLQFVRPVAAKGGGPKKQKKTNVKTRLNRLHEADPELFQEGKVYGTVCQKKRQPVVMTETEYEDIKQTHPELQTIQYSSSKKKLHRYACPKYWCASNNRILTEEEYKSGKGCNKEDVVVAGNYKTAGFTDPKHHPKGFCMPCCFEGNQEKHLNAARTKQCNATLAAQGTSIVPPADESTDVPTRNSKEERVIMKYSSSPSVTLYRWSLLPKAVQYFLNVDYHKLMTNNTFSRVLPDQPCFLLYGIEHPKRQSFLGLFTEIYNYKRASDPPIAPAAMRKILVQNLTLDMFVTYQNGAFLSVFADAATSDSVSEPSLETYSTTHFYQTIQLQLPLQRAFLVKTIRAFENFRKYLQDVETPIDHTYLWDILTDDQAVLIPHGCNLVILELSDDEKYIDLLCPPSARTTFDPKKETFFVLKRGTYYEPIYQYMDKKGTTVEKRGGFVLESLPPHSTLRRILDMVETSTKQCVPPDKDQPVKKNLSATQVERILQENKYVIHLQIWNMEGKIVGFYTHIRGTKPSDGIFVPCLPSTVLIESTYPVGYIQPDQTVQFTKTTTTAKTKKNTTTTDTVPLWKPYQQTLNQLQTLLQKTQNQLLCKPIYKVVDPIREVVTGFITETMQYIPIFPSIPPSSTHDEIPIMKRTNDVSADQTLALNERGDPQREQFMNRVSLETQFYQVFRSLLRQLLNNYENRDVKKAMLRTTLSYENDSSNYSEALMKIATMLEYISQERIVFFEYSERELATIVASGIRDCVNEQGERLYCQGHMLRIPALHLLYNATTCEKEGLDCSNRNIYYMRLADEILRFRRIQNFLFQPKTFLNISSGMTDYVLTSHEILILESFLTDEYFQDMVPFNVSKYIHQTNYDTSEPADMHGNKYNPIITQKDQQTMIRKLPMNAATTQQGIIMPECIVIKSEKESLIRGNARNKWKTSFGNVATETEFKSDRPECTFAVILHVLNLSKHQPSIQTIEAVKKELWKGYTPYMEKYETVIRAILNTQNKRKMLKNSDLETVIETDEYFLTDLDIWVLATHLKLPIVLYVTGQLKMTDIDWSFLATIYDKNTGTDNDSLLYGDLWFIYSPASMNKITNYPAYRLVNTSFKENLPAMKDRTNNKHLESLDSFLQNKVVLPGPRKVT